MSNTVKPVLEVRNLSVALPAGGDLACWKWMGTSRAALRIHLKLIEDA